MTFLNKSAYQCSVFVRQISLDMQHFTTLSEARDPLSFSDSFVCELFLSFLPICLPALNRLKNTHICTHAHPDTFDAFCCSQPQITSRVEESGGSVWWGVGGAKWHCSPNDPEQMSLSQRQTAPNHSGSN